ncbi:unnamed protein product [Prorocentrum cordatum]|uniref:Non-structural maintenance of chromosomes element 4 n=1 Tax=Prorocentrum cordatum TaxID=2364126 RepID=A0ABN9S6Y3_9DINO|nr:unnamed protein product [Polarella glacialis]
MFAEASEGAPAPPRQKRLRGEDGAEGGGEGTAGPGLNTKEKQLMKEMAKLILQHEDIHRSNARDGNVVLEMDGKSKLKLSLDRSVASYDKEGKAAKAEAEEQDETYLGNPQGKKPDAFLRAILYHLHVALKENTELVGADMNESDASAVKNAAEIVNAAGARAPQKNSFQATRCFMIECKDEEKDGKVRWILAADRHRQVVEAIRALKPAKKWQEKIGLVIDDDYAPRSKCAKKVEELAFKAKPKAKGKKK